jgi:hypothetical protein
VSSPASHPKAEFALLPSKLANTKVRIHIVAIEVVTFRFEDFFRRDAAAMLCGTVPYAQARNRHAQTNSNQKLIKKAMHPE